MSGATAQLINISLVPICLPGRRQQVTLMVNGAGVADHTWDKCEAWPARISVPAGRVHIGWNHLSIQAEVAEQPVDLGTGQNQAEQFFSEVFSCSG